MAAKHEFRVVFEGIDIPNEHLNTINAAIQTAALQELSRLKFEGDLHVRIPRKEWLGIWIGPQQVRQPGQ